MGTTAEVEHAQFLATDPSISLTAAALEKDPTIVQTEVAKKADRIIFDVMKELQRAPGVFAWFVES
ncbi:MAG: hypothetical protein R3C68_11085 [Myxococcota bacterium]